MNKAAEIIQRAARVFLNKVRLEKYGAAVSIIQRAWNK